MKKGFSISVYSIVNYYKRVFATIMSMVSFSCIVVAGGKSTRMGMDKRSLKLREKSFFEIAVENARKVSSNVIISLGSKDQIEDDMEGVEVVFDEEKERGPLFALVSSLKACKKEYAALLPVDAPLLNPMVYERMAAEIEQNPRLEAVIPRSPHGDEPLFGMYNVQVFLKACRETIAKGEESVAGAVSLLKNVRYLDLEEFRAV